MSKGKALATAALALLIGCAFLPTQIYGFFWICFSVAAIYGGIAAAKHGRDVRLMKHSYGKHDGLPNGQVLVLPPMTSRGSSRLFVPPPMQRGK